MTDINLLAGWIGILMGFLAGAVQGLLFHKENWLGGYSSWPRRMVRLGHISFFGISFINLSFAFSVAHLKSTDGLAVVSWLFIGAAVMMPLCCYASAFRKGFRHLFFIPALSLVTGAVLFIFKGLLQ
jgi:hypothetical protein